ncbi:hypothetical protein EDC01DRAFT_782026 [Geopyxis carbonaria]|nr:hypothetical protein EDC01DRAFT_782026 [Geopyxis carbonaria]
MLPMPAATVAAGSSPSPATCGYVPAVVRASGTTMRVPVRTRAGLRAARRKPVRVHQPKQETRPAALISTVVKPQIGVNACATQKKVFATRPRRTRCFQLAGGEDAAGRLTFARYTCVVSAPRVCVAYSAGVGVEWRRTHRAAVDGAVIWQSSGAVDLAVGGDRQRAGENC